KRITYDGQFNEKYPKSKEPEIAKIVLCQLEALVIAMSQVLLRLFINSQDNTSYAFKKVNIAASIIKYVDSFPASIDLLSFLTYLNLFHQHVLKIIIDA